MRRFVLGLLLLCVFTLVAQTPNHNAVLITGDTPEGASAKADEAIECGDTISSGIFSLKTYMISEEDRNPYNSFWTDTYLMWEILWSDTIMSWPNDNVHVLYGNGKDWDTDNPRYQSPTGILNITDHPAYYDDVEDVFEALAEGDDSAGIEPMDTTDNLFCWTLVNNLSLNFLAKSIFQINTIYMDILKLFEKIFNKRG